MADMIATEDNVMIIAESLSEETNCYEKMINIYDYMKNEIGY